MPNLFRFGLLFIGCSLLGCVGIERTEVSPRANRPNVVLIMADDMGWGSLDFHVPLGKTADGKAIRFAGTQKWDTPNLHTMADNGLVFARMYSQSPVCSPTRASVLTGRSPERMGIVNANAGKLENREISAAEYAQALGYRTGHFGKWHLGVFSRELRDSNRGGKPGSHAHYATPLNSGYDVQYATEAKTSTYDPGSSGLTPDTRYWTGPGKYIPLDSAELKGDDSAIIAREAMAFMQQSADAGEPFFAVVWLHTPHKPLNTPGNQAVDNLEAYRFAMQGLDDAVGSIRAKLRELGVADNTLVCFTSDNGPEDDQDYCEDPLRANKRELYEGGIRVPGLIEWPARIEPGVTHTPMVSTDYLPTLLDIWGVQPVDDRPFDGQSMATTLFDDREASRNQTIFFKYTRGKRAVIGVDGRYKLIAPKGGSGWELYDLVTDYDEDNSLVTTADSDNADAEYRAIFDQLQAEYEAWTASVQRSMSKQITGDYETRIATAQGFAQYAEPPASLERGVVRHANPQLYLERQHATLREDLQAGKAKVAAGSVVHSYLVHYDPVEPGHGMHVSITFDDPVVAVLRTSEQLIASDALSFADPVFDSGASRGLEEVDRWSISDDGKTVRLMLQGAQDDLDQVRILTRSALDGARR